MLLIAIAKIY